MRRLVLAVAAILTALLLQVDVVNRLHLPGGHPDLVLLVVVSLALVGGPAYGAVAGFAAGFAADNQVRDIVAAAPRGVIVDDTGQP